MAPHEITESGDAVLLEVNGAVATVTLNRPQRLNAMNTELVEGLLEILSDLEGRRDVRAVILTGAGRGFCAGGDVTALASGGSGAPSTSARPVREMMRIGELLHSMPKPTIAAINGACAGAGVSMAAACDLRYAAESAVFVTAFLRVGAPGDHGGIWSVTRAVGSAKARELFLLGDRISATEAAAAGLIHASVSDNLLESHVRDVALRLSRSAPSALRAMKANLNDAQQMAFGEYLDHETQRFAELSGSPESVEAAKAFLEKRDPVFGEG
jgi:2-(1,2-epoxy-1,2-dihydrophenyl)acetyl-CoA isomerase